MRMNRANRWAKERGRETWGRFIHLRYRLSPHPRAPEKMCFLFANPRTGSSLLLDYLRCAPGSHFFNEIMHRGSDERARSNRKADLLPHLQALFHRYHAPLMGFKIQLEQWETGDLSFEDLKALGHQSTFLLLYRRSMFRQFVSYRQAMATNIWFKTRTSQCPPPRIHVDSAELLSYCETNRQQYERILPLFQNEKHWILTYEDLRDKGAPAVSSALSASLGIPSFPVSSTRLKQNPDDLAEIVTNFEEVQSLVDDPRTTLTLGSPSRKCP